MSDRVYLIGIVSMPLGVTGNTSDSGSEKSRFEPWRGNCKNDKQKAYFYTEWAFCLCERQVVSLRWKEGMSDNMKLR